jgi:hypothetical protein
LYHHNTAKLLFLCKRARPDIQTAVAFLSTRVQAPDTDDYKKLQRTMQYLRATTEMPLTIEMGQVLLPQWSIDASFAVHPDMCGHTGGNLTLGKGMVYGTSTRHKINTRSSTEAELVAVYDMLPQVIWTRNFLRAQGYDIEYSLIEQDNKSTILLAENGRASSSKRTRHINIRYFYVTNLVKSSKVKIQYCPTNDMVAGYFTKPVQGALFQKLRNIIMNIDPETANCWDHRSVLEQEAPVDDRCAGSGDSGLSTTSSKLKKLGNDTHTTGPGEQPISNKVNVRTAESLSLSK